MTDFRHNYSAETEENVSYSFHLITAGMYEMNYSIGWFETKEESTMIR